MLKTLKKLFLSYENKETRLRLAKKHLRWTIEEEYHVILTDKASLEIRSDIQSCY